MEIVDGKVLAKLDGMSNLYSAVSAGRQELMTLLENPAVAELEAAVTALAAGELPGKIGNLVAEEGAKIADKIVYVGTESYELFTGAQEVVHVQLALTAEETTAIIEALMKLLDEDADFAAFMQALNTLTGEDLLGGSTLLDTYRNIGIGAGLVVDVYSGETGNAVEVALELAADGTDEPGYVLWRMLTEEHEEGMDFYTDIDFVDGEEPLAGAYIGCSNIVDETGAFVGTYVDIGLGEYWDGEFVPEFEAQLREEPVTVDDIETMQYTLVLAAEDEAVALSVCGYAENDKIFGELVLNAGDDTAIRLAFEGTTGADALLSGVLTGEMESMGSAFAADIKVEVCEDTIETGVLQSAAAEAIDLETITDEQMEAAEMELVSVLMDGLTVLQNNVPGLQGIIGMMMAE